MGEYRGISERVFSRESANEGFRPARDEAYIQIHHPEAEAIRLRGEGAGLRWDSDKAEHSGAQLIRLSTTKPVALKSVLRTPEGLHFSSGDNLVVSPGTTVDLYPRFDRAHGRVVKLYEGFRSSKLSEARDVYAYFPPGFDHTWKDTPVVVMHDGQNVFGQNGARKNWHGQQGLDEAMNSGTSKAVVLALANTHARSTEYATDHDEYNSKRAGFKLGGQGHAYLDSTAEILNQARNDIPALSRDPAKISLAGSSLGGRISFEGALSHGHIFGGGVAAFSPSTQLGMTEAESVVKDQHGNVIENAPAPAPGAGIVRQLYAAGPRIKRLYLDSGDQGDGMANTNALATAARRVGYSDDKNFKHLVHFGAGHNEQAWSQRLTEGVHFLINQ